MFLRFQKIALDVSYGFRQYSPLFLIEVFLIKKGVYVTSFCFKVNTTLYSMKKKILALHLQIFPLADIFESRLDGA